MNNDSTPNSFKNMGKLITETIFKISLNAQAKVDKDFNNDIAIFIYIISKSFVILNQIVNYTDQGKVPDKDFQSQMLLWQGLNTLIGSLQLIRQGYTLEPQFLLRSAVEDLALALSFYADADNLFYKKFIKDKLSGQEAIGAGKKLVKQLGGIYGLLSQVTHPSKKTLGSHYLEGRGTLLIGGGVVDSTTNRVRFNLAILNWIATIYWSSTELIFSDYLNQYTFWTKKGSVMKWTPNKEEKAIYTRSIKLFEEALASL